MNLDIYLKINMYITCLIKHDIVNNWSFGDIKNN